MEMEQKMRLGEDAPDGHWKYTSSIHVCRSSMYMLDYWEAVRMRAMRLSPQNPGTFLIFIVFCHSSELQTLFFLSFLRLFSL